MIQAQELLPALLLTSHWKPSSETANQAYLSTQGSPSSALSEAAMNCQVRDAGPLGLGQAHSVNHTGRPYRTLDPTHAPGSLSLLLLKQQPAATPQTGSTKSSKLRWLSSPELPEVGD